MNMISIRTEMRRVQLNTCGCVCVCVFRCAGSEAVRPSCLKPLCCTIALKTSTSSETQTTLWVKSTSTRCRRRERRMRSRERSDRMTDRQTVGGWASGQMLLVLIVFRCLTSFQMCSFNLHCFCLILNGFYFALWSQKLFAVINVNLLCSVISVMGVSAETTRTTQTSRITHRYDIITALMVIVWKWRRRPLVVWSDLWSVCSAADEDRSWCEETEWLDSCF